MSNCNFTKTAARLCHGILTDPAADPAQCSIARQVLNFIDSVHQDSRYDPFYEDCIRHLALDIAQPH